MAKGRVIHIFQERRELELALKDLSQIRNALERETKARELATRGEALVPIILRHLDTTDPLLRGAMGLVAMYMPRDVIAPPLREVVANPQRSDQERMAALMLLERFLDEPVEESLYAELRNPNAVLEQSLREVLDHQEQLPDIVLDYVNQLQEEPVDVALTVLEIMARHLDDRSLPLLTLLAQDIRYAVAEEACHLLSQTRLPQARAILETLAATLPPPARSAAERGARKMRMRGVPLPAPAPVSWRALTTAPDMHGTHAIWLLREEGDDRTLVGMLVNMEVGIQFAFVLENVSPDLVPPLPEGHGILPIVMEEGASTEDNMAWFLEIPIGHARRWLRRLTAQNYDNDYQLPVMYRQHAPRFWQETATHGEVPAPDLPSPDLSRLHLTVELFRHPALSTWYLEPPHDAFRERRWLRAGLTEEVFLQALEDIPAELFPETVWEGIARRLHAVAEWFLLAGENELALLTVTAADAVRRVPFKQNPFAQMLVARGLALTFQRLQQARDRWDE